MSDDSSLVTLSLRTVVASIENTKSRKAVANATTLCLEKLTESLDQKFKSREYNRRLKALLNTCKGLLAGIEAGNITRSALRELTVKLNREVEDLSFQVDDYLEKELQRGEGPISVQTTADLIMEQLKEALNEPAPRINAFQKALIDAVNKSPVVVKTVSLSNNEVPDVVKSNLKNLVELRNVIPQTIKGFAMIQLPIIPIFDPVDGNSGSRPIGAGNLIKIQPNPAASIKASGLSSLRVEEYTVLLGQLCILIDKAHLPDAHPENVAGRRKAKAKKATPLEYVTDILEVINSTSNKHITLVSDVFVTSPRNPDILIFWTMPRSVLDYLKSKRFPIIRTWNLPF